MSLRTWVYIAWGVFALIWIAAAFGAKHGSRNRRFRPPGLLVLAAFVFFRVFRQNSLAVHSHVLMVIGLVLVLCGLAVAIWARFYLGRNWGMPMTEKDEPQLVTSGPYRYVRHPIYSGMLLAILGTALSSSYLWLIGLAIIGAYFIYSARVEERLMERTFPSVYPSYRDHTKMLIPFLV